MQLRGNRVEERVDELAPSVDAVVAVGEFFRREDRLAPVHQVGIDAQVGAAAVGVGKLGGQRLNQRFGECAQVLLTGGFVAIQQRMPAQFDVVAVLFQQRGQQAGPVAEVVLQRVDVLHPGRALNLAQAHRIDALPAVQLLGGGEQAVPCTHGLAIIRINAPALQSNADVL